MNIKIKFVLICFFSSCISLICADENFGLSKWSNKSMYEMSSYDMSKAYTPDEWLKKSQIIFANTIASWELEAASIYSSVDAMNTDKQKLITFLNNDIAVMFERWLRDRFFGREAADLSSSVHSAIANANIKYLYEVDENGKIKFDQYGDPEFRKANNEALLKAELAAWKSNIAESCDNIYSTYSSKLETIRPELLSYLSDEQRDKYTELIISAENSAKQKLSVELQGIISREENVFMAYKTSDANSTRRKNEQESASVISQSIIRDTSILCDEAISALENKIETSKADPLCISIAGKEWIDEFTMQFERGLSAWANAEKNFMIRRIEWERDAKEAFEKGTNEWVQAYKLLESSKNSWEQRSKTLLLKGEAAFAKADIKLDNEIKQAKVEFDRALIERTTSTAAEAKAWVDIFLNSRKAASNARKSLDFWLSKFNAQQGVNLTAMNLPDLEIWLTKNGATLSDKKILDAAFDSIKMCNSFMDNADKAKNKLLAAFDLSIGNDGSLLYDVLRKDRQLDDLNLDDYQIELLRAQAVENYWKKRVVISKEVVKYASDLSSGRATHSESIARFKAASERYNMEFEKYKTVKQELKDASLAFKGIQAKLDAAKDKLLNAELQLDLVNDEFSKLMASILINDSGENLLPKLIEHYKMLLTNKGLVFDGNNTEFELETKLTEKTIAISNSKYLMEIKNTITRIIDGNGVSKGIIELKNDAKNIKVPTNLSDITEYGLESNNKYYEILQNTLLLMASEINACNDVNGKNTIKKWYMSVIEKIISSAKKDASITIEANENLISFLLAPDIQQWYMSCSNNHDEFFNLKDSIKMDMNKSLLSKLKKTMEFDLKIINEIIAEPLEKSEQYNLLMKLSPNTIFTKDKALILKEDIEKTISAMGSINMSDFHNDILQLCKKNPLFDMYSNEGSLFVINSNNLADIYLADTNAKFKKSKSLYDIYEQYASMSTADNQNNLNTTFAKVKSKIKEAFGFEKSDDIVVLTQNISDALISGKIDNSTVFDFVNSLNGIAATWPSWLTERVLSWSQSLLKLVAAKDVRLGIHADKTDYELIKNSMQFAVANMLKLFDTNKTDYIEALANSDSASNILFTNINERNIFESGVIAKFTNLINTKEIFNITYEQAKDDIALFKNELALHLNKYDMSDAMKLKIVTFACAEFKKSNDMNDYISRVLNESDNFDRWLYQIIPSILPDIQARMELCTIKSTYSKFYDNLYAQFESSSKNNTKHWFEILGGLENNPDIKEMLGNENLKADDWNSAVILDLNNSLAQSSRVLSNIFTKTDTHLESVFSGISSLSVAVKNYMENPSAATYDVIKAIAFDYISLEHEIMQDKNKLKTMHSGNEQYISAIMKNGSMYLMLSNTVGLELNKYISEMQLSITDANNKKELCLADYNAVADELTKSIDSYNDIYKRSVVLHENMTDAETKYEIEDAIRLWASTSYLSVDDNENTSIYKSPKDDYAFSVQSHNLATIALEALKNIYSSNATELPYDNYDYNEKYRQYKASYEKNLLVAKAHSVLTETLSNKTAENEKLFEIYANYMGDIVNSAVPNDFIKFLRLDNKHGIVLSYDRNFNFVKNDSSEEIKNYFLDNTKMLDGSNQTVGALTYDVNNLFEWMAKNNFDSSMAKKWGLARDYVLQKLSHNDSEFSQKVQYKETLIDSSLLGGQRFHFGGKTISVLTDEFRTSTIAAEQKAAYDSLAGDEYAMFNNYLALQLSGVIAKPMDDNGVNTYDAISHWSHIREYELLDQYGRGIIEDNDHMAKVFAVSGGILLATAITLCVFVFSIPKAAVFFSLAAAALASSAICAKVSVSAENTRTIYAPAMNDLVSQVNSAAAYTSNKVLKATEYKNNFLASSKKIKELVNSVGNFQYDDSMLATSLRLTGKMNDSEIEQVIEYYANSKDKFINSDITNSVDAITRLLYFSKTEKNTAANDLKEQFEDDMEKKKNYEAQYKYVYSLFINGKASKSELELAAKNAYGNTTASHKKHLNNLALTIQDNAFDDRSAVSDCEERIYEYYNLINDALKLKHNAAWHAKQLEFDMQKIDLNRKRQAWHEASDIIINNGLADFSKGLENIQDKYEAWKTRFSNEYSERTKIWNKLHAEMLSNKLAWVYKATNTANDIGNKTLVALTGLEAEALCRSSDVNYVPYMDLYNNSEELYHDALQSAGIKNMEAALQANINTAESLKYIASNTMCINKNIIKSDQFYASEFAIKSKRQVEKMQAKMMAYNTKENIINILSGFEAAVKNANNNMNNSMNKTFVEGNGWKRTPDNYIKDVVVHSTLTSDYLTEHVSVAAYANYEPSPWKLSVDLSDIENMDNYMVKSLIEKIELEIKRRHVEVFGEETDNKLGVGFSGKFGEHVGEEPKLVANPDPSAEMSNLFTDKIRGELGRLMSNYIYWRLKESKGWAEANRAFYDKKIWDDRNSFVKAPSIRDLSDLLVSIGSNIIAPGVGGIFFNLIDDAVFGLLDGAGGYKDWASVGLDFGKKALAGAANYGVGLGFGKLMTPVKNIVSFDKVVSNAALQGFKLGATTVINSATSAINIKYDYDASGKRVASGLSFSTDAFTSGLLNGMLNNLATVSGGVITNSLNLSLNGFTGKLADNAFALSNLVGGLSEQGLKYLLTGTASFNLANLNMFGIKSNDEIVSHGLLEMNLGKNGNGISFGGGGMDVSYNALASSISGLEAWKVNSEISSTNIEKEYRSALRTLYSVADKNSVEREMYKSILDRKTIIEKTDSEDYVAKTQYNAETGTKTVFLGKSATNDKSRFGLNIIFAHEAYRNGIDDGEGQKAETKNAVLGHINAARKLGATWGMDNLDKNQSHEVIVGNLAKAGFESLLDSIMAEYDSSSDYWKLISYKNGDTELLDDGKSILTVIYRDLDKDKKWEDVSTCTLDLGEKSIEKALIKIIGVERAYEILGEGKPDGVDKIFSSFKDKELGTRVMKKLGMTTTDKGAWTSGENFSMSLTGKKIPGGYVLFNKDASGKLEKFTVDVVLNRKAESWNASMGLSKPPSDPQYKKALDTLVFTKRDLNGNVIDKLEMTGVQSVDVYDCYDNKKNVNRDQPYYDKNLKKTIQGNTVVGNFSLSYHTEGTVYYATIHNAMTRDGDYINKYGSDGDPGGIWYIHGGADNQTSDGCFIIPNNMTETYYKKLAAFNIPNGGQIAGRIDDEFLRRMEIKEQLEDSYKRDNNYLSIGRTGGSAVKLKAN